MKTQIKQTIAKLSALAFVFAMVVSVAPKSSAIIDGPETVDVNAVVAASLQLQVDTGAITLNVDPDVQEGTNMTGGTASAGSITGGTVSDSTTTSVQTNDNDGYRLWIQLNGQTTTGSAVLDGAATSETIVAGDYSTENTFGYALTESGASTVDIFQPTATVIENLAGNDEAGLHEETNNHDETIFYYLNVDYTVPADTYQGTITYTASVL